VLEDGRVVLIEPVRTWDGLACPGVVAVPHRPRTIGMVPPSMRLTTGPIGPFTTGRLPPLTTFSNSQPTTPLRR
jgi:hypothetical protein